MKIFCVVVLLLAVNLVYCQKNREVCSTIHSTLTSLSSLTSSLTSATQLCNGQVGNRYSQTARLSNQGPPGKKGPKGDKGESSSFYVNQETNRRFASKLSTLHKQLSSVQVESQNLHLRLNTTQEKLKEENEILSAKLNATEEKLSNVVKMLEDYKAQTHVRLSEFAEFKRETESLFSELAEPLCLMKKHKSCTEWGRCQNTPQNDTYSIQPDPSLPSFDVECSFNGNTAITTVHHNSEDEIEVTDCETTKCYNRLISYTATIPQMRALISLDGECRQYIKYRCWNSVLFRDGQNYAGWETWNGTMRHYWGGSGGRDNYCACGITGTCADTNWKCNCDKNDNIWREDVGFLDQEDDLPATKIYFGDASGGEYGHHTLGSLQCQQSL